MCISVIQVEAMISYLSGARQNSVFIWIRILFLTCYFSQRYRSGNSLRENCFIPLVKHHTFPSQARHCFMLTCLFFLKYFYAPEGQELGLFYSVCSVSSLYPAQKQVSICGRNAHSWLYPVSDLGDHR